MNGVEEAAQDLLGLGAAHRAIAAADFAGDHGGAQCVFGAPVGGVNGVGLEQKREDGGKLNGEMPGEMARDTAAPRSFD